jgi:predicted metalloprotease with PDZ domain
VGNADQAYRISLCVPQDYSIACGLKRENPHILLADSFDHLADCPLIASNTLHQFEYSCRNIPFHIWIQGKIQFDIEKLILHFKNFTEEHFSIFSDIPCEAYHFLFQFPEIAVRHGVEHRNSTVIAMGPSGTLAGEDQFLELLGISCHELFHTWNVKNIRPMEMLPYDFTRENYSPSGLVYEGVTTYYGDLLLWRVGTFSDLHFFEIISETLENHLNNDGRFHLSVAKSSLETWLDGYVQGNPWRKVNIYNEGSLIAFICDVRIIANTSGRRSLDDVMALLYRRFGTENRGYTLVDYRELLEEVAGVSFEDIFNEIVLGQVDYLKYIQPSFSLLDLSMKFISNESTFTSLTGARYHVQSNETWMITDVMENSPADQCGLWRGDMIQLIDEKSPASFTESSTKKSKIQFLSQGIQRTTEISWDSSRWYSKISLEYKGNSDIYEYWKSRRRN